MRRTLEIEVKEMKQGEYEISINTYDTYTNMVRVANSEKEAFKKGVQDFLKTLDL